MAASIKYGPSVWHRHSNPIAISATRPVAWQFRRLMLGQHSLEIDFNSWNVSVQRTGHIFHIWKVTVFAWQWERRAWKHAPPTVFISSLALLMLQQRSHLPGRNRMSVFRHAISVWFNRNSKIWWMALYNLWIAISFDGIAKSETKSLKSNQRPMSWRHYEIWKERKERLLSMGNPYCADIMMNNSAQLSSSKRFWSLLLSWLNDGIDFVQRTARKSNLAADSNTISWLVGAPAADDDDDVAVGSCMVRISSELLTSSSFPFKSLIVFVGSDSNGNANGLGRRGLNSDSLFDESGEM